VQDVWGVAPLRIREGGVSTDYLLGVGLLKNTPQSIPSVPFLEKEFGCHALHLPMGQSSVRYHTFAWSGKQTDFDHQDQAHLPNERISLLNLQKGKAVVEQFLINVSEKCSTLLR
jgi:di- and tripeptidase